MEKTVTIWKRVSAYEYEPYATSKKEMKKLFNLFDRDEMFCPDCGAVVEAEGKHNRQGLYSVCPFCGRILS
jgi:formamidopyrimidine-DNA glycosylase